MSSALDTQILSANERYAAEFNSDGLKINPKNELVIGKIYNQSTAQPSLDPAAAYGFKLGDTTVVRNAGASARDGPRSTLLTTHVLGAEDIYVIKHTRCGLLGVTTELAHGIIKSNLVLTQSKEVDEFEIFPIADLEDSAKEDVEYLRNHPLKLKKTRVMGWIIDTDTGIVRRVVD